MSGPLISIITPSYNQIDFIEKNIQSVCSQDHDKIEHIIIDGGSNDGTLDILEKYEDEYNLRWVSEGDRGQSHAINKGVEMACGELIGWQNSDDFYVGNALDLVAKEYRRNSNIDVIYGDTLIVDEDGNELSRKFHTRPSKFSQRYWSLFARNQSLFIKKKVFDELGGIDENLHYVMDAKLTWQLLEGNFHYKCIPRPLGAFRIQQNAKTFGNRSKDHQLEKEQIYPHTWYEDYIPQLLLEKLAKFIKAKNLVLDCRFDALYYNIKNRFWH
ncbi:glycosyltransferase family 2 protein [Halorubrum distributum]|uniref:glycosyltransferase family 2 protein n=1 Tax=Halorubrum distributum TaxID=29283 RepID=UPI002952D22E|nr:glycosyltransferase family 2 protein [Halorubrum distributum]MDV7349643.1 glycosyltransferase family 2 protein [Halorubrum distributum]